MWLKAVARVLPGWAWALIAAVALGGGGWLWYRAEVGRLEAALAETRSAVTRLTTARDQWQARAERHRQDLADAEARGRALEGALRELQASLAEIDARYRDLRGRIDRAPAADDGEVAPVLRDTLEALP